MCQWRGTMPSITPSLSLLSNQADFLILHYTGKLPCPMRRKTKRNALCTILTLSILRRLSYEGQGFKIFFKSPRPCHVGIFLIALAEYSQMSTHVPGFQLFFRFFALFYIDQIYT